MTGHIRQRSPGSFELRYSVGSDPITGKRRTATATFRGGKRDAEKELRRLLTTVDTGSHAEPNRLTVGQWLTEWLATVQQSVAPRTHQRYAQIVEHHLSPKLGGLPLDKLSPRHVQQAHTFWLIDDRRDGRPGVLRAASRRYNHIVLRAALQNAVKLGLISKNPCDALQLPKPEHTEMSTLTPEQSEQLLEAAGELRTAIMLGLSTGMRRGEILALQWRHVDLDGATVIVSGSVEQMKGSLRIKSPKSGKTRSILLPASAVAELRRMKIAQAESLLAIGVRQSGKTFVCTRADGATLKPDALSQAFVRLVRSIPEFPLVRLHDLRHTNATAMLEAGVNPKVAQERLGHANVGITLDLYSHVSTEMQREAAAKIDATFRGKS
jgi:integrase